VDGRNKSSHDEADGSRFMPVGITFDKDFGELAWRVGLPASCGIVLFRLPMPPAAKVGAILAARIGERT